MLLLLNSWRNNSQTRHSTLEHTKCWLLFIAFHSNGITYFVVWMCGRVWAYCKMFHSVSKPIKSHRNSMRISLELKTNSKCFCFRDNQLAVCMKYETHFCFRTENGSRSKIAIFLIHLIRWTELSCKTLNIGFFGLILCKIELKQCSLAHCSPFTICNNEWMDFSLSYTFCSSDEIIHLTIRTFRASTYLLFLRSLYFGSKNHSKVLHCLHSHAIICHFIFPVVG